MPGFAPSLPPSSCESTPRPLPPPPLPPFTKLRKQRPREADSLTRGCRAKKHLQARSLFHSCVHFFPGRGQAGSGRRGFSRDSLPPVTSAAFCRLSGDWIRAARFPHSELSGGQTRLADQSFKVGGEWVCRRAEEFASEPRRSAVWMAAQHTARQLFS